MNPTIVDKFIQKMSLKSILDANATLIMDFALSHRSYDNSKFSELIEGNSDWACIIAAHIHVDHVLDKFLEEYCVLPKMLSSNARRMSATDKCAFLAGVGALSEGSVSAISVLNRIRNKFAHELNFSVSSKSVNEFRSAIFSSYQKRVYVREEYIATGDGKLSLKMLLKLTVLFIEEERLAHLVMGLTTAHSSANLGEVMRSARKTLDESLARDALRVPGRS